MQRMSASFEHVGCEAWERERAFQVDTECVPLNESAAAVFCILNSNIWKPSFIPRAHWSTAAEHQSALHNVDLALRNLVGLVTQAARKGIGIDTREEVLEWLDHPALHGKSVQHIAAVANAARKRAFEDFRKGDRECKEMTDYASRFAHFLHAIALEYTIPPGEPSTIAAAARCSSFPAP
jgi:hypothetical protein